jgi:hypothetical protein
MRKIAGIFAVLAFALAATLYVRPIPQPSTAAVQAQPSADAPVAVLASASGRHESPGGSSAAAQQISQNAAQTAAKTHEGVYGEFERWVEDYSTADAAGKSALEARGLSLVQARRQELLALIASNPNQALEMQISYAARAALPESIAKHVESFISLEGTLTLIKDRAAQLGGVAKYEAVTPAGTFTAHSFGRFLSAETQSKIALTGIAIDKEMALSDDASQVKQFVEPFPPMQVASREGPTGGAGKIGNTNEQPSGTTFGKKRYLIMRVNFPDESTESLSEFAAYASMEKVAQFYYEVSYGKYSILPTVTPLLTLPRTRAWHNEFGSDESAYNDAKAVAKEHGYDPAAFDVVALSWVSTASYYDSNKDMMFMASGNVSTLISMFAEKMGMPSSGSGAWSCATIDAPGSKSNNSNPFDAKGPPTASTSTTAGTTEHGHFNVYWKNAFFKWLPDYYFSDVTASGQYRIYPMDYPTIDPANKYAVRIKKDALRTYHIEFRQNQYKNNAYLPNGVTLNFNPFGSPFNGNTTTAASTGLIIAADTMLGNVLLIGKTFADRKAGVFITPVGKAGTTPEAIDLVVNMGDFPANQEPSIATVAASSTVVPTSTNVTFTATASDPDGDTLAYFWTFGDGTYGTNAAAQTKKWTTAGQYRVRCEVTDMKGKTASRSVVVRVGTPAANSHYISGTCTVNGLPLAGALVSCGSVTALTDSDGTYTLTNVNGGTVSAAKYGIRDIMPPHSTPTVEDPYANNLYPTFANPLPAGFDYTAKNFESDPYPQVAISAVSSTVTEGGSVQITFTRSFDGGADDAASGGTGQAWFLSKPLGAYCLLGTTGVTNDSPQPIPHSSDFTVTGGTVTGNVLSVLIPAGSYSTTVTLNATADAVREGPEHLVISLNPQTGSTSPGLGYVTSSSQNNTLDLTIQDNSASPPLVTLSVIDGTASRIGGDTGMIRLTRTGSTAAPLIVICANAAPYSNMVTGSMDGFASYGVDYEMRLASDNSLVERDTSGPFDFTILTIPAGSSSIDMIVKVIRTDAAAANKLVPLTIAIVVNNSYLTYSPDSAFVKIIDDVATLSIAATVSATSEFGGSKGVFTVSRTGDLSRDLTVPYSIGGKALNGTDYARLWGSVVIPASQAFADITIDPNTDTFTEDTENVDLELKSDTTWNVGYTSYRATVLISDVNTNKPMVSVQAADGIMREILNEVGSFRFQRLNRSGDLTVKYTISGTAAKGADYAEADPAKLFSGSVVIKNGTDSTTIDLYALTDAIKEDTEMVVVTLLPDAEYGILTDAGEAVVLLKDGTLNPSTGEVLGEITVTAENPLAAEPNSEGAFVITRTGSTAVPMTVSFAMSGTATLGVDYSLVDGDTTLPITSPLSIPIGSDYVRLKVVPIDDAIGEGTEKLKLTILPSAAHTVGVPNEATVKLLDDADPLTTTVKFDAANSSGIESASPAKLAVSLNEVSASVVTVDYKVQGGTALGGVDYILKSGTLTFSPGELTKYIEVVIVNDEYLESNETIQVIIDSLYNAKSGGQSSHIFTIIDDDSLPSVKFAAATSSGNEDTATASLVVTLDQPSADPVTVTAAISGGSATNTQDYTLGTTLVTFNPGETSKTVTLNIIDDLFYETSETIEVTLSNPVNAKPGSPMVHTFTLADNDLAPNVQFSSSASSLSEAAGSTTLNLVLSKASGVPVTVNFSLGGSATSGADYSAPSSVTFAPGETTQSISVGIVNDAVAELDETVVLTISSVVNAATGVKNIHTLAIVDDEVSLPVFSSGISVNPTPAVAQNLITFSSAVSGGIAPFTYAWAFGDGATGSGALVAHIYATEGTYAVSVSVVDAKGQTATLSQNLEVKPLSSIIGGGGSTSLSIFSLAGKMKFATGSKLASKSDTLSISGVVNSPAIFNPIGVEATIDVGGAVVTFVLDKKFKGKNDQGTIAIKNQSSSGPVIFSAKLKKGAWSQVWIDDGISTTQDSKGVITLPVKVKIGSAEGTAAIQVGVATKANKGGSFKK